jgi:hypothetical protein
VVRQRLWNDHHGRVEDEDECRRYGHENRRGDSLQLVPRYGVRVEQIGAVGPGSFGWSGKARKGRLAP